MDIMKRLGLAALFTISVTLFESTPARAGDDWGTIDLMAVAGADDPDYGAAGTASLTNVTFEGFGFIGYTYGEIYAGDLSVSWQGLTPGAIYRIGPVYPDQTTTLSKRRSPAQYVQFQASANGTGEATVQAVFVIAYDVLCYDPDGRECYTYRVGQGYAFSVDRKHGSHWDTVLGGFFPYPYP